MGEKHHFIHKSVKKCDVIMQNYKLIREMGPRKEKRRERRRKMTMGGRERGREERDRRREE